MNHTKKETKQKIATLNVCLSLKNKKLEIETMLQNEEIDVMCLQEIEIEKSCRTEVLAINDFLFEIEVNTSLMFVGVEMVNV